MKMTRTEKNLLLMCPWIFGMVLLVSAIVTAFTRTDQFVILLLTCSGLLCISLYCVCVLLIKLVEK